MHEAQLNYYLRQLERRVSFIFKKKRFYLYPEDVRFVGNVVNNILATMYTDTVAINPNFLRKINGQHLHICKRHLVEDIISFIRQQSNNLIYLEIDRSCLRELTTGVPELDRALIALSTCHQLTPIVLVLELEDIPTKEGYFCARFIEVANELKYSQLIRNQKLLMNNIQDALIQHISCVWCHPSWLGVTVHSINKNYPPEKIGKIPYLMREMVTSPLPFSSHESYKIIQALSSLFSDRKNAWNTYRIIVTDFWERSGHHLAIYYQLLSQFQHQIINMYFGYACDPKHVGCSQMVFGLGHEPIGHLTVRHRAKFEPRIILHREKPLEQ